MKTNIVISGSRTYDNDDRIRFILKKLNPDIHTIIHGGCKGLDLSAGAIAEKEYKFEVIVEYAQWKNKESPSYSTEKGYDPKAGIYLYIIIILIGPIRNELMLTKYKPEKVYLFHDDIEKSLGTKNMMYLCNKYNILWFLVLEDEILTKKEYLSRKNLKKKKSKDIKYNRHYKQSDIDDLFNVDTKIVKSSLMKDSLKKN